MILIAGGVLLALVTFAVLRRVFMPLVMIALGLWLWSGHAHSQPFTQPEMQVMMEREIVPVLEKMQLVMGAIRCGILEAPMSTAAVLTLRNQAGMVAMKYESLNRRKWIVENLEYAESTRPNSDQCREMRADAELTSDLKMWAGNLR